METTGEHANSMGDTPHLRRLKMMLNQYYGATLASGGEAQSTAVAAWEFDNEWHGSRDQFIYGYVVKVVTELRSCIGAAIAHFEHSGANWMPKGYTFERVKALNDLFASDGRLSNSAKFAAQHTFVEEYVHTNSQDDPFVQEWAKTCDDSGFMTDHVAAFNRLAQSHVRLIRSIVEVLNDAILNPPSQGKEEVPHQPAAQEPDLSADSALDKLLTFVGQGKPEDSVLMTLAQFSDEGDSLGVLLTELADASEHAPAQLKLVLLVQKMLAAFISELTIASVLLGTGQKLVPASNDERSHDVSKHGGDEACILLEQLGFTFTSPHWDVVFDVLRIASSHASPEPEALATDVVADLNEEYFRKVNLAIYEVAYEISHFFEERTA